MVSCKDHCSRLGSAGAPVLACCSGNTGAPAPLPPARSTSTNALRPRLQHQIEGRHHIEVLAGIADRIAHFKLRIRNSGGGGSLAGAADGLAVVVIPDKG